MDKFRLTKSFLLEKIKSYEQSIEFYNKHSLENFWNRDIQDLTKKLIKHCENSIKEMNEAINILI